MSPVKMFQIITLGVPEDLPVREQVAASSLHTLTQLTACLASIVNLRLQSGKDQILKSRSKHPVTITSFDVSKSDTKIERRMRKICLFSLVQKCIQSAVWNFFMSHGVWKSHKKSHFTTLRAKWATLTYWIKMTNLATFRKTEVCGKTVLPDKSISIGQNWWKMPKLKNKSFQPKKCYQYKNWTKIGEKGQNWKIQMRHFWMIFQQCASYFPTRFHGPKNVSWFA